MTTEWGKSNTPSLNHFGGSVACYLMFLIGSITVTSGQTNAQDNLVPPEIANQPPDNRSAHAHNADMSCCARCAPEANRDADVFRRVCFVRALTRARQGFHAYYAQTDADGIEPKVAHNQIPQKFLAEFEAFLTMIFQPAYVPPTWRDAGFFVPYPLKSVVEVRGGVRMLVGNEVYRAEGANTLKNGDPIQTVWTAAGIALLPVTLYNQERPPQSAYIRLRLRGGEQLALGKRPENFTRSSKDFDAFFDRTAFHTLLAKVFRVPFESPETFLVDGFDTEYEGVRVFHGRIRSREWAVRSGQDRSLKPPHWWDEMRLLVTDSDPQYFCVQISFGEDDRLADPEP